jgi:hypothetical protein
MKRYTIEATRFELDGTESHTVLHDSNSISGARAYLEGFTDATAWNDYDLINLLDTAHPSDSDLHLIDSKLHPSIDIGATSQTLSDFAEVWTDVTSWGGRL